MKICTDIILFFIFLLDFHVQGEAGPAGFAGLKGEKVNLMDIYSLGC